MDDIPEIYFPAVINVLKEQVIDECRKEKFEIIIDKFLPLYRVETFSRYIIMNRQKLKGGQTGFTELLTSLDSSFRQVCELIRRFNINQKYVSGFDDNQRDISRTIEETMLNMLMTTNCVFYIISGAREEVIAIKPWRQARYILAIDPIDGIENVSSNFPVATTFAIYRPNQVKNNYKDTLHTCGDRSLIVGGYVIYGAATVLVLAFHAIRKVQEYIYDPVMGEFVLIKSGVRIPDEGKVCCVDNAKRHLWMVEDLKNFIPKKYAYTKHSGSFVMNFHLILKNGGVLVEPPVQSQPQGQFQIISKLNPLAFICQIAGGLCYGGDALNKNILRIRPRDLHETSPFLMGSPIQMDTWRKLLASKFNEDNKTLTALLKKKKNKSKSIDES